jgi:hypothetical protein
MLLLPKPSRPLSFTPCWASHTFDDVDIEDVLREILADGAATGQFVIDERFVLRALGATQ